MTREEAIEILWQYDVNFEPHPAEKVMHAIDMAIEALSEPKTITGIDIPYGSDKGIATIFNGNDKMVLEEVKEIMSVVRCKDCKNWRVSHSEDEESYCYIDGRTTDSTDYCSWGERREP
jgi:hypothetical protein